MMIEPDGNGDNVVSSFDELLPGEMASKAQEIGIKKAHLDFLSTLALAVLAGAFIALGCIFFDDFPDFDRRDHPLGDRARYRPFDIQSRAGSGDSRWCRAIHRQQPNNHGLGKPQAFDLARTA
jgi:hypothetical protein